MYVIALSVLVPPFGTVEWAGTDDRAPAPTAAEQPLSSRQNFSVAVGTDNDPQVIPAIQNALTDYLSLPDEFLTWVEQGAVAPDFSTTERDLSPESARSQANDGTSALAVLLRGHSEEVAESSFRSRIAILQRP